MLPVPSISDLARFTGRDVDTYSEFANQALSQATLLFSVTTRLTAMPSDPAQAELAGNAIAEMADRLYLEQGYAETLASPFQSETIGSYTYAKQARSAGSTQAGSSTGLLWWDLAVELLSASGFSSVASGSIGGGFDTELGQDTDGRKGIRSPVQDMDPPYIRIS